MFSTSRLFRLAALATFSALAFLVGPAIGAANSRGDDATASPALKSVQGVWSTRDDSEVPAKWTIKGDAFKAMVHGAQYLGKVSVDDAAKPHPTFTVDITEGPGDVKGKVAKGVYKLDGEKLYVNLSPPGEARPTSLDPVEGEAFLFELTKAKDAE
ncbi:hypothetical protein [Planctomyces sp. SH-PL62]|uniref:hypothetical protein n=1 Tax=Planctomyces sp. SH-PL62 TaxID=1636152 RepID=UPI00078BD676|nr:hypothetical protein [Planctomyces sp. SH-PL62]AMV36558.1 hypothetical protein VT85_03940 [Planctomyces sp. SH-PL62]